MIGTRNGYYKTTSFRIKTGKHRGGQAGHAKAKLRSFEDDEITNTVDSIIQIIHF